MMEEKYGTGRTMSKGEDNWMFTHGGPFKPDADPDIRRPDHLEVTPASP